MFSHRNAEINVRVKMGNLGSQQFEDVLYSKPWHSTMESWQSKVSPQGHVYPQEIAGPNKPY